jgi:preprotein translocase subunit SecF
LGSLFKYSIIIPSHTFYGFSNMIPNIYKGDYRLLAIVPLALIIISLFLIPNLHFGVDFRGGTLVTLQLSGDLDAAALEESLSEQGFDAKVRAFEGSMGKMAEVEISQTDGMFEADSLKEEFNTLLEEVAILEASSNEGSSSMQEYESKRAQLDSKANRLFEIASINEKAETYTNLNQLKKRFSEAYLEVYNLHTQRVMDAIGVYAQYTSHSIETVSPALSLHFIDQAGTVVLYSAIVSVILVFFFFRAPIPSAAVLVGAFSDIVIALGAMSLFGIPLSLPSFAALLMLVGFSLDTDILLTMRILKRRGDPRENAFDAMKTGMTMSITAIVAFSALFILAMLTHISTYYEISAVALAGLVGDLFATWGINAVMVLYYKEKRG